jgi:hypothetical protein
MLPFVKAGGEMTDKVRTDEEMQAHLMRVGLLCTQWAYSNGRWRSLVGGFSGC